MTMPVTNGAIKTIGLLIAAAAASGGLVSGGLYIGSHVQQIQMNTLAIQELQEGHRVLLRYEGKVELQDARIKDLVDKMTQLQEIVIQTRNAVIRSR